MVQIASGIVASLARPQGVQTLRAAPAPSANTRVDDIQAFTRDRQSVLAAGKLAGEIAALNGGKAMAGEGSRTLKAADGGLVEIKAALDRMKTLATDAKSTKYSDVERQIFNLEFGLKRDEITDIVNRTKYKGSKLLDGGGGAELSLGFNVGGGTAAEDTITVKIKAATLAGLDSGLATADLLTITDATSAETVVLAAIVQAVGIRGQVGAYQEGLHGAASNAEAKASFLGTEKADRLELQASADQSRFLATEIAEDNGVVIQGFQVLADAKTFNALIETISVAADGDTSSKQTSPASEPALPAPYQASAQTAQSAARSTSAPSVTLDI
jgi:flagellin-like hook-associated protein FlgL